ncbi:hypothetical protein F4677DRAFT_375887 [Hypoxylon crocopeplum]|nr:hypothetical protein F4677DRAFT_375887 [Hypoxylon crocopeplum]
MTDTAPTRGTILDIRIPPNLRRSRSLSNPGRRPLPLPIHSPRAEYYLPSLRIEFPAPSHHSKSIILRCPSVPNPPRWLPSIQYGRRENELKFCDVRSLDNRFPFPLEQDLSTVELSNIPDRDLARIILDWRRTPVLSFRHDTQNGISRIASNMVAKWGPGVYQSEADMLFFMDGIAQLRNHVPEVHNVFRDPVTGYLIIIMEHIEGPNLVDIWHRLNSGAQGSIADRVVMPVRLMQTSTARYPGPMGLGRYRALMLKNYHIQRRMDGPAFERYMNSLVDEANRRLPEGTGVDLVSFPKFVLANMQLDSSSFVLSKVGRVYIVGWGLSGFYPVECELGIAKHRMPASHGRGALTRRLLLRIPHDQFMRESVTAVAALIDGDLGQKNRRR